MIPRDLRRVSEGHYEDTLGRGRVIRLAGDARWVAVHPTGRRSPIVSTLQEAHKWLLEWEKP